MPPRLAFTTTGDVDTNTLTGMSGTQRGVTGGSQTYRVWNDRTNIGASTARRVKVMVFYQMTVGSTYLSSGVEPADLGFIECRLTGNIVNPGNNTDPDAQAQGTEWTRIGGRQVFTLPLAIPPYFAREIQFRMNAPGGGGQISINDIRVGLMWDQGVTGLDIFADEREGRGVVWPGGPRWYALLAGKELQGARLKRTSDFGGVNAKLLIEEMTFCLSDEVIRTVKQESTGGGGAGGEFDDNAADGATGATQAYRIVTFKNPTGTGFTHVKGNKATSGSELPPSAPGVDYVPIGACSKPNVAISADITTPVNQGVHWPATLTAPGGSAVVRIGPYFIIQGGVVQDDSSQSTGTALNANATEYVKISSGGLITVDNVAPTAGEIFIGIAVTNGATQVTSTQRRAVIHGRGSHLLSFREVPLMPYQQDDEDNASGQFFALGALKSQVTGAIPQTIVMAGGHRIAVRITAFTTYGTMTATGDTVNGEGIATIGDTEVFRVNKVGDWFYSTKRFTGNVALTTADTLVADVEGWAGEPWNDLDRPVHIRALALNIIPAVNNATVTVRLMKIPFSGAVQEIYNQTVAFGTGVAGIKQFRRMSIRPGGGAGNITDQKLHLTPTQSVFDPWIDEGIYLIYETFVDIKSITGSLFVDKLMR